MPRVQPYERSIPACAGEPKCLPRLYFVNKVYPRVCGGTACWDLAMPGVRGLSPRVRGNRLPRWAAGRWFGSIPACAGEPVLFAGQAKVNRVYPRVCGGTPGISLTALRTAGLSPRVRGNLGGLMSVNNTARSIPACAGEPFVRAFRAGLYQVYPRVCGGTSMSAARRERAEGLSPRVRGNHTSERDAGGGGGSIPACAGEPLYHVNVRGDFEVYPRVCGGTRGGR